MSDKYVLATDDNGNLAVRTVTAEESPTANSTDVITATTDGKLAVRVVGASGGGGSDPHNLGWYATQSALETAHPTGSDGDFAILGSTDTVWVWDGDTTAWKDTDTKGQVTSVNGQTGAVTVDTLPDQTGNSGKFLTTDGTDASWSDKPLVNRATGTNGIGIGGSSLVASGNNSIAVGPNPQATASGAIAIGVDARATVADGIAIGDYARSSANKAYQIGTGTNGTANSFQVGSHQLLNLVDGTIPTARLTKVNTTITLTAAGWSSNTQTVTVNGVTSTSVVFVSPDPADTTDYVSAGILCTSQGTNSLTFTATTTPSADIDVNVVML